MISEKQTNGASAYARFYHRRLPTYEEWLHEVGKNEKTELESEPNNMGLDDAMDMQKMHTMMMEDQSKTDKSPEVLARRLSPVSAIEMFGVGKNNKSFTKAAVANIANIFVLRAAPKAALKSLVTANLHPIRNI